MVAKLSTQERAKAILASVTKGNASAPWRVVIYGARGVGKSTMASQCPGVLMVPIEEGTNQLRVDQLPQVKSWQELHEIVDTLLVEPHEFKALALDGIDSTDPLVIAHLDEQLKSGKMKVLLRSKKEAKSFQDLNEEFGGGYLAIVEEWRRLAKKLDLLRHTRGMRIILVGHAKANKIENLEGRDYDKWEIQAMGKGTAQFLSNWADYVLFAKKEADIVEVGNGRGFRGRNENKIIAKSGDLVVLCRPGASHDAKTRGDIPWPEKLPVDWATFERTAKIIVDHGRELPGMLRASFESLVTQIQEEERREAAKQAFEDGAANNHYVYQQGCIERVKLILQEQEKVTT